MTCEWCTTGGEICRDGHREAGYVCTRETGHDGFHVACARANENHRLLAWPQDEHRETIIGDYRVENDPRHG